MKYTIALFCIVLLFAEPSLAANTGVELPAWANSGNIETELSNKGKEAANLISVIVGILSIIGMLVGAAFFSVGKQEEGKKYLLGGIILIVVKYGQGGAHLEEGSTATPLTEGLADNDSWVWGALYINPRDPAIMIEKRFGIGYTPNFGNWKALLILAVFLMLIFGFAAFAVFDTLN